MWAWVWACFVSAFWPVPLPQARLCVPICCYCCTGVPGSACMLVLAAVATDSLCMCAYSADILWSVPHLRSPLAHLGFCCPLSISVHTCSQAAQVTMMHLHAACATHGVGLPEVQALLLAHPEAASATDGSGRTALHWAVGNNQVGIGVVEFITSMSNAVTNAKQIDAAHYKLFLSHVDRLHLDVLSTEELDGLKTQWNAMRMWSYEQHLLCPARFQSIVLTILLVLQHSCVESDRLGNRRVVDPRVFLERIVRALPPNDAVGMLYWPLE